jgi:hypothetical protein
VAANAALAATGVTCFANAARLDLDLGRVRGKDAPAEVREQHANPGGGERETLRRLRLPLAALQRQLPFARTLLAYGFETH